VRDVVKRRDPEDAEKLIVVVDQWIDKPQDPYEDVNCPEDQAEQLTGRLGRTRSRTCGRHTDPPFITQSIPLPHHVYPEAVNRTGFTRVVEGLNELVGENGYVLALTADHCLTPYPEVTDGWSIEMAELRKDIDDASTPPDLRDPSSYRPAAISSSSIRR
jgi:hypothetical protein